MPRPNSPLLRALRRCFMCVALVVVSGCATNGVSAPPLTAAGATGAECDPARDRQAIRMMAGEFDVAYDFEETEVLTPGYEKHKPYHAGATEVVEVLGESERMISLQHVLMVPDDDGKLQAMKHWRQDWTFEATQLVQYVGRDTWQQRELSAADAKCTWSQAVFEVTDAPRYEGTGRWVHAEQESVWLSNETWRPLPRREYTKRKDYDVLLGTNRHVARANGWLHQQDNVKLVLEGERRLVRERGENTYERVTKLVATPLAHAYLVQTASFWQAVRDEWQALLVTHPRLTLRSEVDGKPLYEPLFELADTTHDLDPSAQRAQAHEVILRYVQ